MRDFCRFMTGCMELLRPGHRWRDVVVWARISVMLFSPRLRNTGNTKFN